MRNQEGSSGANGGDAGSMDNLSMSLAAGPQRFEAGEQLEQHRTKSAVSRRMKYVRDAHIDWADNLASIALGVVLVSTTREANAQEQVRFLYLALGGSFLRSHRGQTFIYEDGAVHLFNGVVAEYMIARCKEYAECVEGGMWCIGKRGDTSRSEADIFAATDRAYKCISAEEDSNAIAGDVSGLNVNIDGERRGVERQRKWLNAEPGDAPVDRARINEGNLSVSLSCSRSTCGKRRRPKFLRRRGQTRML